MELEEERTIHTVLIRTQDGRINLLGCSSGFPFPPASLPEAGSRCPAGTAAYEIDRGLITEFKGIIPIERWIKPGYLNGDRYTLWEHSLQLLGQILTLLEIEVHRN
ncbi:MAG: hypothetical protein HPY50_20855 [Firmicutes bacterium]|nr:hypothetical protein [Bacillota bacterium]